MYPDWVTKHKQKGTNISCIRGRYYLYEVSSVWDKEKGRAKKITNKYLGRITEEEGFVPAKEKTDYKQLYEKSQMECAELKLQITALQKEVAELKGQSKL